jgi:uncharacterized protein
MRLLLFNDVHRDLAAAQRLVVMSRDAGLVIGAGDFATKRQGLPEIVSVLSQITCLSILVPGNAESFDELEAACRTWPSAHVLHGSGVTVSGIQFWGVGGAIPETQFGSWSWDLSEDAGRHLLAACPIDAPRSILVSHSPPHGVVDESHDHRHNGSLAVREAVERCHPTLVVCGHIHEHAGKTAQLGSTRVINAGPAGLLTEMPEIHLSHL